LDEVGYCIGPNALEGSIDVNNMHARVFDEFFAKVAVHQHDDLLVGETFHGHIDFWFGLIVQTVNDFLNQINFLIGEIRECFLEFQHIPCNA